MSTCPYNKCKGTGFIEMLDASGEEVFGVCQCRKDKENTIDMKEKFIGAFFPLKLVNYSFDSFIELCRLYNPGTSVAATNEINLATLKRYIDKPDEFLNERDVIWIKGDHRSGKTSLALALGKSLLMHNKRVRYIVIEQLCKMFKSFNSDDYSARIAAFEKFDVYIIDDIFDSASIMSMSKYDYQQLYSFVKLGLLDNKKFIFISNHSLNELDKLPAQDYDVSGLKSLITNSYKEFNVMGDLQLFVDKKNK